MEGIRCFSFPKQKNLHLLANWQVILFLSCQSSVVSSPGACTVIKPGKQRGERLMAQVSLHYLCLCGSVFKAWGPRQTWCCLLKAVLQCVQGLEKNFHGMWYYFLVCASGIFAAVALVFVRIHLLRLVAGDLHPRGWPLSLLHSLMLPQMLT